MFQKFGEIEVDKKNSTNLEKPVYLNLVDKNKIVVSDKFELEGGDKYYVGYKDGDFVRSLCIILPQMIGFIKYFHGSRQKHVIFK